MQPFKDFDLHKVFELQIEKLQSRIESFTDDEIMANDLELLADNCYEEYYIEPLEVGSEEFGQRDIKQSKIKKWVDPFFRIRSQSEFVDVDGYIMTFYYTYTGEKDLFQCRASTYSLSGYPNITVSNELIAFRYDVPLNEMRTDNDREKLMKTLEKDIESINNGISYVNSDVEKFNSNIRKTALNMLMKRKNKAEQFISVSKMFEIPIQKKTETIEYLKLKRNIQPITRQYNNESNYCIRENDYKEMLKIIKHNCSTYERTPDSFKSLQEEDIRNLLLAALNGLYQGTAAGETFRKKGKTDICIECDNRAAFVAECKIWKGQSRISEAITQLDNYLTWRDCKTALIYFVRNKDFLSVLDTAKQSLYSNTLIRQVKELDKNEFECSYLSQSTVGQIIKIRVMLFNLYSSK